MTAIAGNVTNILTLTQTVNDNFMFGWFGTILLIAISIVIFSSFMFSINNVPRSFAATSYIAFGLSLFLRGMNLIPNKVLIVTLICCGAAIAFTWQKE